jgi:hypothetical protein
VNQTDFATKRYGKDSSYWDLLQAKLTELGGGELGEIVGVEGSVWGAAVYLRDKDEHQWWRCYLSHAKLGQFDKLHPTLLPREEFREKYYHFQFHWDKFLVTAIHSDKWEAKTMVERVY